MTDPKTRRRRYLRFSLRTFLVVLTLACVWFGWMGNLANRQRQAVAWVLEMGRSCRPSRPPRPQSGGFEPSRIRELK